MKVFLSWLIIIGSIILAMILAINTTFFANAWREFTRFLFHGGFHSLLLIEVILVHLIAYGKILRWLVRKLK